MYVLCLTKVEFSSFELADIENTVLYSNRIHVSQIEGDIASKLNIMQQECQSKDFKEQNRNEIVPDEMSEFFLIPRNLVLTSNFMTLVTTYKHPKKPEFLLSILNILVKHKLPIPPYISKNFIVIYLINL